MRLKDKVAIVTGSSSGLGRAIATLFAEEGAQVVVNAYRNVEGGEETLQQIKDAGGDAVLCVASVATEEGAQALTQAALDNWGRVDILVNNAGIEIRGGVLTLTSEEWDTMLSVDLKGIFLCSKFAAPEMIKVGGGSIVNVTSVLGLGVIPERAAYCAAKAGAIHLSKSMALDLAQYNIRSNALVPGAFLTPLLEQSMIDSGDYEGTKEVLTNKSVFGRMGEHRELAYSALFLASDEASFVTGAVLQCDGGWFLG